MSKRTSSEISVFLLVPAAVVTGLSLTSSETPKRVQSIRTHGGHIMKKNAIICCKGIPKLSRSESRVLNVYVKNEVLDLNQLP